MCLDNNNITSLRPLIKSYSPRLKKLHISNYIKNKIN
jgi:hypothetical protein